MYERGGMGGVYGRGWEGFKGQEERVERMGAEGRGGVMEEEDRLYSPDIPDITGNELLGLDTVKIKRL